MSNYSGLLIGSVFISPILVAEDILRFAGADVHEKGMFYNKNGKSIMEIWNDSKPFKAAEAIDFTEVIKRDIALKGLSDAVIPAEFHK